VRFTRSIAVIAVALIVAAGIAGCTNGSTPHPEHASSAPPSARPVPPTPKRVEDLSLTLTRPTRVTLRWGKPGLNGGSDVIRYGVATWIVVDGKRIFFRYMYVDSTGSTTSFAVPRLETGTSYAFGIKAYNADNRDAVYGNIVTAVTGMTHPHARPPRTTLAFIQPRDVEDSVGTTNRNQLLTLQWRKPSTGGGYGIDHYLLERRIVENGRWHPVDTKTITDPAKVVRYSYYPLVGGTEYEVRVRAVTTRSAMSAWGPWNIQTIYRVDRAPDAPATPRVTSKTGTTVTLSVARPDANGGYFINKYWVTTERYEKGVWTPVSHKIYPSEAATLTAVVANLAVHTRYRFRVSAVNFLGGEGPQSGYATASSRG
jgi:hypothetical protein